MLSWRAPESLRGRFQAVPEVKMGPFPVDVGAPIDFDLAQGRMRLPEARVGSAAPDFVLLSLDASTVQLTFLRGRHVVVCFLCPCHRCRSLAAALAKRPEIARRAHVLAVFADARIADSGAAQEFRSATAFAGPILLDYTASATLQYQSQACPRVWVIGPDGRTRYASPSATAPAEQLAAEVSAAIE